MQISECFLLYRKWSVTFCETKKSLIPYERNKRRNIRVTTLLAITGHSPGPVRPCPVTGAPVSPYSADLWGELLTGQRNQSFTPPHTNRRLSVLPGKISLLINAYILIKLYNRMYRTIKST